MSRPRKILFGLVAAAMFGLLLVVVFGDKGWLEMHRMRATHTRLLQENERLTQENLRMYRSIERMQNDPEFIENVARRELGMIRGDELIFTFKDAPNTDASK
jgi:cell division protein FtsB